MRIKNLQNFITTIRNGQIAITSLSREEKKTLEKTWDIEHAYYSSTLEGSKLDRKEFDKLAKTVT